VSFSGVGEMDSEDSEIKENLDPGLRKTGSGKNKRGEALYAALEKEDTLRKIINRV
jgi:hypothetical protein